MGSAAVELSARMYSLLTGPMRLESHIPRGARRGDKGGPPGG